MHADAKQWISQRAARREPSAIRALQPLVALPGMISLGGGLPNPETFPFETLSATLKSGERLEIRGADCAAALQYSGTAGLVPLLAWIRKLEQTVHAPPELGDRGRDVCLGVGSQDVLTKAFEAVLDEGDTLLIESPSYPGSLAFLRPLGVGFAPVPVDADGISVDALRETLQQWDQRSGGRRKPRVLYTIPTGANPTGATTSAERRCQVYALAQEHDLLILEDDPYYYLQFDEPRVPSYLSMDTDGRVLRFDSVSKVLSSGLRLGWVSGPSALVERITLHAQATTLHPSGVSQALMLALIRHWGDNVEQFLQHASRTAAFYKRRRDLFVAAAERHIGAAGLARWTVPRAGMFLWMELPTIQDTWALIHDGARREKVLLVPGADFYPVAQVSNHVRASFSTCSEADMDVALERFQRVIRAFSL